MKPDQIYHMLSGASDDVEIWEILIDQQFPTVTVILDNEETRIEIDGTSDYIVLENPLGMSNGAVSILEAIGVNSEYA